MTQEQALSILKTGANVFLTGEPGTGKTYTINAYVRYLRERDVEVAITASTGIAATHIGGMTIHSWSGIGIKRDLSAYDLDRIASTEYVAKRVRRAKVLVIDEISMLSADTLSMVDAVCREVRQVDEAFGGLQVILVGDFFQLPPIVRTSQYEETADLFDEDSSVSRSRFSFASPAFEAAQPIVCYLSDQYRQDDATFLSLLTAIRRNTFDEDHLVHLEGRKRKHGETPKHVTKLFSHNADVDKINTEMLNTITGSPQLFSMTSKGGTALVMALKKGCLSPEKLFLKVGAEVMCTKNNSEKGFVNGTLGIIHRFESPSGYPVIKTRDGREIVIEPMEWTVEENGQIRAILTQVPLRLAWAMTVHKSQGMSLDEAVMDLSNVFEYGQGYVALSRVRRLSGLHILGWNRRTFEVDPDVLVQDEQFREESLAAEEKFADIPIEELEKMHENFIVASGGTLEKKEYVPEKITRKEKKKKGDTVLATLALWKEGKTVEEIAAARKLAPTTIWSHIENLVMQDKISHEEINVHVSEKLKDAFPKIHALLRSSSDGRLAPIFKELDGEFSFNDIRIARMLLKE